MRFNGICIITEDVKRLASFYAGVLQVDVRFSGDDFARLSVDGAGLDIFAKEGMDRMIQGSLPDGSESSANVCGQGGSGKSRGTFTIEMQVDDVDAEYERLKRMNVHFVKLPTTQPWGRRSLWFSDPDGNIVNFYKDVAQDSSLRSTALSYFERLINQKDLSVCTELLSDDYRDHDAPPETPLGPQAIIDYMTGLFRNYPDFRIDIEDVLGEGQRVVIRATWRGTHKDTGKLFNKAGIVMLRFNRDGKIAERWSGYVDL